MKKGFTIIELLMALLIIGLLVAAVTIGVKTSQAKARDSRRFNDLKLIQTAVKSFYIDTESYPTELQMDPSRTSAFARSYDAGIDWTQILVTRAYITQPPMDPLDGRTGNYIDETGDTSHTGRWLYGYVLNGSAYKLFSRLEHDATSVGSDGGDLSLTTKGSCPAGFFNSYESSLTYEIGEGINWGRVCP